MDENQRLIRFGEFEVDTAALELRRRGRPLGLNPRPFRLLLHLLEQRPRVVAKDELLAAVWPDVVVSDAALSTALKNLRQVLAGNSGQVWIRTLRGLGYQFAGQAVEDPRSPPTPAAPRGIYGVPRGLSMCFVGRSAELQQLEALLVKETYVSVQASVEGLAGVGKTELALHLVHKLAHAGAFSGGIFWLDAEQPDLRSFWAGEVAERLGVTAVGIDERCQHVLRRLAEPREPVLLVLDNVASWDSSAIPGPLPAGPHIRTLVTTRERALGGPRFVHVELGFLEAPHDRELVEGVAGRTLGPALDGLLEYLGGHALGLELAGAFLATYPSEAPRSYLELLRKGSDAAEQEVSRRVRYERTVAGALGTVWDRLGETERTAWLTAACFEPEHASRELAAVAGLGASSLRSLERSHLIRSSGNGRWIMHRLTRAFGQQAGGETERREAQRRFVRGCLARALEAEGSVMERYLVDRPHFDAAVRIAADVLGPETELRLLLQLPWPLHLDNGVSAEKVAALLGHAIPVPEWAGNREELLEVSAGLFTNLISRSEWARAGALAESVNAAAARIDTPAYWLIAHATSGAIELYRGAFESAVGRFARGIALFRSERSARFLEPSVSQLGHAALAHCIVGQPDDALELSDEALRFVSSGGRSERVVDALMFRAYLQTFRGDAADVERCALHSLEATAGHGFPVIEQVSRVQLAWASFVRDPSRARELWGSFRAGMAQLERIGLTMGRPDLLVRGSRFCAAMGAKAEGLTLIEEGLARVEESGERLQEAELWRCKAALCSGPEALECLQRAIAVAEQQGALWWSLRAVADLAEAAPTAAERAAALQRLRAVYGRFQQGFALPDLQRARELLAGRPAV